MMDLQQLIDKFYDEFDRLVLEHSKSTIVEELLKDKEKFSRLYNRITDKFGYPESVERPAVIQILAEIEGEIEAIDFEIREWSK